MIGLALGRILATGQSGGPDWHHAETFRAHLPARVGHLRLGMPGEDCTPSWQTVSPSASLVVFDTIPADRAPSTRRLRLVYLAYARLLASMIWFGSCRRSRFQHVSEQIRRQLVEDRLACASPTCSALRMLAILGWKPDARTTARDYPAVHVTMGMRMTFNLSAG